MQFNAAVWRSDVFRLNFYSSNIINLITNFGNLKTAQTVVIRYIRGGMLNYRNNNVRLAQEARLYYKL